MRHHTKFTLLTLAGIALSSPAGADTLYNNLTPNNQIGVASRPGAGPSVMEIEAADDFVLNKESKVESASFTGLLVPGTGGTPSISQVVVEMYRVFPNDSDTKRTPNVVTRVNSPSDVAFDSRDSAANSLTFKSEVLNVSFTTLNSVQPGGIHPKPGQTTGGDGPLTGQEVQIDVTFKTPFDLPADHYFFVPQVELSNGGQFYWLSASRPISGAGTTPFLPDLQSWTRDAKLDPDWSRVGTDIVGGSTPPTFNASFQLDGSVVVPEPSSAWILAAAGPLLLLIRRRNRG